MSPRRRIRSGAKATRGIRKTLTNLDKLNRAVHTDAEKTLIRIGLQVQAKAQKYAPVDVGNLRASAFTVWGNNPVPAGDFSGRDAKKLRSAFNTAVSEGASLAKQGKVEGKFRVVVGFGAHYAIYVHEGNFASVGDRGPKYLERAFQEIVSKVEQEMAKSARAQIKKHRMR